MKSLNVSRASCFVIIVIMLTASLFSGTCLAGISIGEIYGPLSLDSAWPPQGEGSPCWNPDGTMIAFRWGDGYTAYDPSLGGYPNPDGSYIVIMTADGQAIKGPDNPLVNDPYWDNGQPDWSPDGNWIVYVKSRVGPAQILKVPSTGGDAVPITQIDGNWHPNGPKWSPDGTKIAYRGGDYWTIPDKRPYHIWLTDTDGSTHEDLTPSITGYGVHYLSWSPDGTQIVFAQEGEPGLLVLDVATKAVTSLPGFPSGLTPSTPVWASQNSILFDAAGGIYDYQIDTQTTTQLTFGPDGLGDWHPTAGLVFSSTRGCTVRWDSNIWTAARFPNQPPVADAGDDLTVEQESYAGASVTLDGSGSNDDGQIQPLTYTWTWASGSATGINPTVILPLGTTTVTLTVSDGELSDTDTLDITVEDTTPPAINSISASPDMLWPPNHKMVEVTVMVDCKDICDQAPFCYILGVSSNEPINGPGDGNTEPDWDYTEDPLTVLLRAERAGFGTGRVYTIHMECMDASENIASGIVEVTVPHDQGKGKGKK